MQMREDSDSNAYKESHYVWGIKTLSNFTLVLVRSCRSSRPVKDSSKKKPTTTPFSSKHFRNPQVCICQHLRTVMSFSLTKTFCSLIMSHLFIFYFKWVGKKMLLFFSFPQGKRKANIWTVWGLFSQNCHQYIVFFRPHRLLWNNYSYHPFFFFFF